MLSVANKNPENIRSVFAEHITSNLLPAVLYATLDNEKNINFLFERENLNKYLTTLIIPRLKEKNSSLEGQINLDNKKYYWFVKDISSFNVKDDLLIILFPLSSSVLTEVLEFFGLPFFISGFLLLWVMVWTSIILSSLVTKLQNQKQKLSDQAVDIERARDDALSANKAKSLFLANMSHEMRTPLTSIIGFAESSLDLKPSIQERLKATKTIIRSGKHLLHIINEVLDLSKIEAGKLEIETMPVSVMELLDEISQLISIMAEEKGLLFKINYEYPLPEKIISDPLRIKQILINLCANAIKFTTKGHVFLNVSYISASSTMVFEVIDTGIGMSVEEKEKIFKPFEQGDSGITRKYGGTGLGLTLSKQLVEKLNGELTVESEINKGSQFTVKIKTDEIENCHFINEGEYISRLDNVIEAKFPELVGKILVVEDNADIQDLIEMLLNKVGLKPNIVANGSEAISRVSKQEYDLILMDIQMPIMDGFTAMSKLHQQGYEQPIIAMTANAMQNDRDECASVGFTDFISKPIDRSDLYSILGKYLKTKEGASNMGSFITSSLLAEEPDLIDLIDKFIVRVPVMRDDINHAFTANDNDELARIIHQLKGVGGGYGYPKLTELCANMEEKIESQDGEGVAILINDLNSMVDKIINGKEENHKISDANK